MKICISKPERKHAINQTKNSVVLKTIKKTKDFNIDCSPIMSDQKSTHRIDFNAQSDVNETESREWSIEDFQVFFELGQGKFGTVFAAREKKSDFIVALKKFPRQEISANSFQKQIKREISIQTSLRHPNILKLFGYFWDSEDIYLILEYAPKGELYKILQKAKTFRESQVSAIIRQVCQGLEYLHQKNIIHRDIKPENILVSLDGIKIADFGWSVVSNNQKRDTLCGTLDYLAPEMVKGVKHDGSVDVWEVGVLAYELAVGHPPFETNSYQQTYSKIVNDDVIFPHSVSFELRSFIRKCLRKNPKTRISIGECLKEEFISKYAGQNLDL